MTNLKYLLKNSPNRFDLSPNQPTMMAIVTTGNGGYDKLSYRKVPMPVLQSGFNAIENVWMASDFDGAFAQYVKVPESEVFAVNCDWSDEELATIPCAYGTAENMVYRARVSAFDRVLVTGASGGVGSAVVQLAKRRGAQVTAVTCQSKVELVKSLGADRVVTRDTDLLSELGDSAVEVVIDNVADLLWLNRSRFMRLRKHNESLWKSRTLVILCWFRRRFNGR